MKKTLGFAVIGMIVILTSSAFAQSVAVAGKIGTAFGKFNAPFGSDMLNKSESAHRPIYGVELLFLPQSRVTIGVEGVFDFNFKEESFYQEIVKDSFHYICNDSELCTYSDPGTVFAASEFQRKDEIKAMILGSLYINAGSPTSRIRPFVGGGFGLAFAERFYDTTTYVDPIYHELAGFEFQISDHSVEAQIPVWKAEGGLTVRLAKHFLIRGSVRVMNNLVMPMVGLQIE